MNGSAERKGLRVLITNRIFAGRSGTELYVRDLATGLAARGHSPIVFSPLLGPIATELREKTIPVTNDLAGIGASPDVIHGHHALETLAALLAFPGVPAIAFCHSWVGWPDVPPSFPRILRYVAVDQTCRDRLTYEAGVPEDRVELLLNAVDLRRFAPRPPLPARPRRALVFSNAAGGRKSHLGAIREACGASGIEVEAAGWGSGRTLARPEDVLPEYDLVFAKAKAALEAMAVGAAVVLCDSAGAGPLVTTRNFAELRAVNFGFRALREPITSTILRREIDRYDPADAAEVSRRVRSEAGHDTLLDDLCELYETVIEQQHASGDPDFAAEGRAAAIYLQRLGPRLYQRDFLRGAFLRLLKTPGLGSAIRAWGRGKPSGHWFEQALALEEAD